MTFQASLKSHLQGGTTLAALVKDRIYPVLRPQDSDLPAVTFARAGGDPVEDLDTDHQSLRNARVQVDCWGRTYDAAAEVGEAVWARLGEDPADFAVVSVTEPQDSYDEDQKVFRVTMDFSCWYTP